MGLFTKFSAASDYEKHLKSFGVNPYNIPADVNARICSFVEQQFNRTAKNNPELGGSQGLSASMQHGATIVAHCILGPTGYGMIAGGYNSSINLIEEYARDWSEWGPEVGLETKIIKTLNDASLISDEFIEKFNSKLNS